MRKLTMLLMALLFSSQLFAQSKLTGKVLDGALNNEPMIGASVMVVGTSTGCITDMDGNFSLTVPKGKSQIVVSSVGYKSQTINVTGRTSIRVVLKEDSKVMDEVVVV